MLSESLVESHGNSSEMEFFSPAGVYILYPFTDEEGLTAPVRIYQADNHSISLVKFHLYVICMSDDHNRSITSVNFSSARQD